MLILVLRAPRAQKQSTSARHVRQDATPRVKESRGRERGRHAFIACVLNEWVCWCGQWNGRKRRSEGGGGRRGRMQRRVDYAMGHSRPLFQMKSCSFFQIMQLEKHLCSCTPRVALRHERPSMCVLQPTRSADPGTSFFRLSPFPSLPFPLDNWVETFGMFKQN